MNNSTHGLPLDAEPLPLRLDEGGAVLVGNGRISLDLVVEQYENGMTPEDVVAAYDTLALANVYAVIAYYLRHRDEVRAYRSAEERKPGPCGQNAKPIVRVFHGKSWLPVAATGRRPMLRLASDANVHGEIVRGLRRRLPEIDLVRVQDALPEGTPNPNVLAWTAAENRVLVNPCRLVRQVEKSCQRVQVCRTFQRDPCRLARQVKKSFMPVAFRSQNLFTCQTSWQGSRCGRWSSISLAKLIHLPDKPAGGRTGLCSGTEPVSMILLPFHPSRTVPDLHPE